MINMTEYKIGDLVYGKLGTAELVGTVIYFDEKREKYLVRFGENQQIYYLKDELRPYKK